MTGRLITFEGGEGAGKSSVLAAVRKLLERRCVEHRVTREPGGTPLGEAIRALVLDPAHPSMCAEAEVLLMFAARAQHVAETIRPALEAGLWVVSDRYTDASYAYQSGGRGLAPARIEELERWAAFGVRPDRTFLLDVPVAEGLRRIAARGESDRMERETIEFFERVRTTYLARAQREPGRFRVVDATQPLEGVVASVLAEIGLMIDEATF
ncbi:MAG TPA: dTMP kinase [Candidatus Saccharimonadia bacterium]|nr:dTMP kinase [Candidatus Saccharimonadia bacterium]